MKTVRAKLPAIVLIAAAITAMGVPVFANQIHPVCAVEHHECGKAARIASCCCHDRGDASTQGGPVEAKVQVNPHVTIALGVFVAIDSSNLLGAIVRPHTSPPRAGPPDLPTLFSSLLI